MKIIWFKDIDDLINKIVFRLKPVEFTEFNSKLKEIINTESAWRKKMEGRENDKNNR